MTTNRNGRIIYAISQSPISPPPPPLSPEITVCAAKSFNYPTDKPAGETGGVSLEAVVIVGSAATKRSGQNSLVSPDRLASLAMTAP
ncbi:MAG: hypothetical protein LBH85_05460, partial [Treponema sp.]|nr:hypothetical protein [Treponema sp.]